ncbi:hypothetical protein XENOCAPTIV_009017, partial [Xenoophorus captivus]
STKYHSELRCVIVYVEYSLVARVNMKVLSSLSSGGNVNHVLLQQISDELARLGLPSNITMSVLKSSSMIVNTTATPSASP